MADGYKFSRHCVKNATDMIRYFSPASESIRNMYFWSKFNIWNINCARATALIFDTRIDVLVKVSKFLSQKMPRPEADSSPQPLDSCRMLLPFEFYSYLLHYHGNDENTLFCLICYHMRIAIVQIGCVVVWHQGPLYLNELTLIPARMINHMPSKVR